MTQSKTKSLETRLRTLATSLNSKRSNDYVDHALLEAADFIRDHATAPPQSAPEGSLQSRVQPWMMECFGPAISADREERNDRFIEEALELVQASGYTAERAHALVDYVFGRPQGEINQEVGGVMITLAAHCLAHGVDMHEAGETELARIWTKVDQIRAKQAAKPKHSPLPISASPTPQPVGGGDGLAGALEKFNRRDPEDDPPWPQDSDLEGVWQKGVSWALLQVGKFLGIKNWYADGASESVEGDVAHEIGSIFATAKLYDPESGAWATLVPAPDAVDLDALEKAHAERYAKYWEPLGGDYDHNDYEEALATEKNLFALLRQSTATKGPGQ